MGVCVKMSCEAEVCGDEDEARSSAKWTDADGRVVVDGVCPEAQVWAIAWCVWTAFPDVDTSRPHQGGALLWAAVQRARAETRGDVGMGADEAARELHRAHRPAHTVRASPFAWPMTMTVTSSPPASAIVERRTWTRAQAMAYLNTHPRTAVLREWVETGLPWWERPIPVTYVPAVRDVAFADASAHVDGLALRAPDVWSAWMQSIPSST
jgi:hypothetical protein